ncbi:MAG TPA: hypothetical protein VGO46_15105 [Gemmatimonadaceae bacterium]|nr:hypothetical protein [Gemmatimonadaceae bacterium]
MIFTLLTAALLLQGATPATSATPARASTSREVQPVLFFPESGMDDTAAYEGYVTRLYRDSKRNTVQIYLDRRTGRAVLLWADALDESAAFTTRDAEGKPASMEWDGETATVTNDNVSRTITYRLRSALPSLTLGWFLLGTMRVERDFQYDKANLREYGAPPYVVASETTLVANVARLPAAEQRRQLTVLGAASVAELRSRLTPAITSHRTGNAWSVRVSKSALDGKSHLALELIGDTRTSDARVNGATVVLRALDGKPLRYGIRVTTDGTALTPLSRGEIFNGAFLDFLAHTKSSGDTPTRYRRLEREVRSVELLASGEKLMAGLPNYATYFGRDGLMTALMMRSVWTPEMSERTIASVLAKLAPTGDVSHEEALGEQAIRERAEEYNAHVEAYFRQASAGDRPGADTALAAARLVLSQLRRVRENYHMMDDEFQLPVLEALYLADTTIPAARKRAFLRRTAIGGDSYLALMLREIALVATETKPFAENPIATNLVGFVKSDSTHWRSASWRDSDVGYANGRFAMDINAIWAPRALESIASVLSSLRALGFTNREITAAAGAGAGSSLVEWVGDSTALVRTIERWTHARALFVVALGPSEIAQRIEARLAGLPPEERNYWKGAMSRTHAGEDSLVFLALSLDERGAPIPVVNTDPATDLFLTSQPTRDANGTANTNAVLGEVAPFLRSYPVGLFVSGLGPVVANDAYATPAVWQAFEKEAYHSPRVVWGREVNLYLLGLADHISSTVDGSGKLADPALAPYVRSLRVALDSVLAATTASHLQHNEVWSYRIVDDRLSPTRYGSSSDVQLWSTTDLAVQFALSRLPRF